MTVFVPAGRRSRVTPSGSEEWNRQHTSGMDAPSEETHLSSSVGDKHVVIIHDDQHIYTYNLFVYIYMEYTYMYVYIYIYIQYMILSPTYVYV